MKATPTQIASASRADDLIQKAKGAASRMPDPSREAQAELRKILEWNDSARWNQRVGHPAVLQLLQTMGWQGRNRQTLDRLCARLFGRKTFGTP